MLRCCNLMHGNFLTHNHCHPELLINVEPLDFNDSGSDGWAQFHCHHFIGQAYRSYRFKMTTVLIG
ncbi:TPA: hypothetical protein MIO00_02745 [Klebsiella pneumoniae]|nr:hypothetical protein [Salmonella enterica]HBY0140725.1 hypothetical protein [Klebsiella pneumoniae]